jgi:deoxyribonuclease V
MIVAQKHSWAVTIEEAREIQVDLSRQINSHHIVDLINISVIGGADISFNQKDNLIYATIVFFKYRTLELLDVFSMKSVAHFPYVPGYLSFREIPPLLELVEKLDYLPDILLCDGQGIAHPRGLGLASHLGLILDIPTIGCAKSVLIGDYNPPQLEKGAQSALIYEGRRVGIALRPRSHVKPVYVSVGHKIRLEEAGKIVLHCTPKYRIPEPLRFAHKFVNAFRTTERNKESYPLN